MSFVSRTEHNTSVVVLVLVAIILYLLSKANLLHESVTSGIVTPQGTVTPDPVTGAPRFSPSNPATLPANYPVNVVAPIDGLGNITTNPADPRKATCPAGYQLWQNADSGAYWCILSHLSDGSQGPV